MKKKYFEKLGKNTSKKASFFLHFSMLQNWQRIHFKWRQVQKVLRAYLFAQFSPMPYTPTYLLVKKVTFKTQNRKLENSVNVHCEKNTLKNSAKTLPKKGIIFLHFSMLQNWQRTHFKWRQVQKVLRAYLFAQFSQILDALR